MLDLFFTDSLRVKKYNHWKYEIIQLYMNNVIIRTHCNEIKQNENIDGHSKSVSVCTGSNTIQHAITFGFKFFQIEVRFPNLCTMKTAVLLWCLQVS